MNPAVVAALARRSIRQTFRRPQFIAPILLMPTLFLAVNTGGADSARTLPGFPDVAGFLDFELAGAMVQASMLAGLSGGIALAIDIEIGFTDRLLAAPIPRPAIVLGRLGATGVMGAVLAVWFLALGLVFGAEIQSGVPGVLLILAIVPAASLAFGSVGAALALWAGRASVVQGIFPLVFVVVFLSSAFFPRVAALRARALDRRLQPDELHRRERPRPDHRLDLRRRDGQGTARHRHRRRDRGGHVVARAAPPPEGRMTASVAVTGALMRRALNEVIRVPGAALPGIVAPTLFMLGLTAVFGNLTNVEGFGTSDFLSFMAPVSLLQCAGFTGAAVGVNLARDIEQGWFDRLLVSPASRPVLLASVVLSAALRVLMPVFFLLAIGFSVGLDFPGLDGMLVLFVLVPSFAVVAACWGSAIALRFRTQAAGPLIQSVMFIFVLFTASYAPKELLAPWLEAIATVNPVNLVIEGLRAGFIGDVGWADFWPAALAVLGMGVFFGALALRGLRTTGS